MDIAHFEKVITDRLAELGVRIHEIDAELGHEKTKDMADQAVDLEDDEVLEGIGIAAQNEILLLKKAMTRIKDGTYGTCLSCGEKISDERLEAVPYAPLCRTCANRNLG